MSKYEELLTKYCSKGFQYKRIEEVCIILDKVRKPVSKGDRIAGDYPYYGANGIQDYVSDYLLDGTFLLVGEDGSVINEDKSPVLTWAIGKIWVNNHAHILSSDNLISLRFIYYSLQTLDVSAIVRGVPPKLNQESLRNLVIPFPPIEIQEEIVRILDSFIELTAVFTTDLTAEIAKRKKQCEYYCNKLLTFDHLTSEEKVAYNIESKKLGEIATIVRGASPRPIQSYITSGNDGVNWIKIGDTSAGEKYITSCKEKITQEGAKKSRIVNPGDFILSNSMSFGRPYILKITGCIHDGWLSISDFEDYVIPDYLYYLLNSTLIQDTMSQKASSGTVQNLNADIVKSITISIPCKEVQTKIVSILDRLYSLCADLQKAILAEIENCKMQFRFYRDKLLSFPGAST